LFVDQRKGIGLGFAGNRFLPFQGRERILVYGPNRFHFFRRTGDDDDGSLRIPLYSPLSKSTCDQKEDLGRSTLPEILKQRVKSTGWQPLGFSCRTQRADEPEVYGNECMGRTTQRPSSWRAARGRLASKVAPFTKRDTSAAEAYHDRFILRSRAGGRSGRMPRSRSQGRPEGWRRPARGG